MKAELSLKDFDIYIYTYKTKAVMFGDYILAGHGSQHSHVKLGVTATQREPCSFVL